MQGRHVARPATSRGAHGAAIERKVSDASIAWAVSSTCACVLCAASPWQLLPGACAGAGACTMGAGGL
jgi:hypothetical protein